MKNFAGLFFCIALVAMIWLASCQNTRTVRYPFGPAEFESVEDDTTLSLTVSNSLTYFTVDTLEQETTINGTVSTGLPSGTMVYIRTIADADTLGRNILCGTNFVCDTIKLTTSKSYVASFIYDGSDFIHLSTQGID